MDVTQLFDEFHLRTRVYPALLVGAPIVVNVLLLWPKSGLAGLWPVLLALGVLFLLSLLVRGAGKRLEERLTLRWNLLPAQAALRLAGSDNPLLTARRRAAVERLTGRALPTRQQETGDRAKADREYEAAIRELIPRVRGKDKDALLHAENIHYNFWRNALACKPPALVVAAGCAIGDGVLAGAGYQRGSALVALLLSSVLFLIWVVGVTEPQVRQAAETYAQRLHEALATL